MRIEEIIFRPYFHLPLHSLESVSVSVKLPKNRQKSKAWLMESDPCMLRQLLGKIVRKLTIFLYIFLLVISRRYCLVSSLLTKRVESMVGWDLGSMTVCKQKPILRGLCLQSAIHTSIFFSFQVCDTFLMNILNPILYWQKKWLFLNNFGLNKRRGKQQTRWS